MTALAFNQWRVSSALQQVQLQATAHRLDVGSGHAKVVVYKVAPSTEQGVPSDVMAEVLLAKPAGVVNPNGDLVLQADNPAGTMVLQAGIPRWAQLVAADGAVLVDGGVTDAEHDGCFQVSGAATPEGDTSPMFYAGVLLTLAPTALT